MYVPIISFGVIAGITILWLSGVWKSFEKAGYAGWKAIIPVYNLYVGLQIIGRSGWWLLLVVLPLLSILAMLIPFSFGGLGHGRPMWMLFSGLASVGFNLIFYSFFVAWISTVIFHYDFVRSFGKDVGFTLGLYLLPIIFWPILGFGDAEYRGPAAQSNSLEPKGNNQAEPQEGFNG